MKKLTIATRGSKLALWQANEIKDQIQAAHPGRYEIDLLVLKTKGDIILDVPLAKVGGKGLFTKEIEEALLDGRADLAVHSMKDVPAELPEGLVLGCIPRREDETDSLLAAKYPISKGLDHLPQGAVVGTSSLRRQCQMLALRPDLTVKTLRGNVDTRLAKLVNGDYDAILMATAAMKRLGLSAPEVLPMGPPEFLPAVGQGALGIEFRDDRSDLREVLAPLHHQPTAIQIEAERGFLLTLEGGCQVPIAGHATIAGDTVRAVGLVASLDGKSRIMKERTGSVASAYDLGVALAEDILAAGGKAILQDVYGNE